MSIYRWFVIQRIKGVITGFVSGAGTLTILTTITDYFKFDQLGGFLKSHILYIAIFLLACSIIKNRPKNKVSYHLNGRDVKIEFIVGDIFKQKGVIVVPMNSQFDTTLNGSVMKTKSVQCFLIQKYFNSDPTSLKTEINKLLKDKFYKNFKTDGNSYKLGTTVPIESNSKKFYLLANSKKINESRVETNEDSLITSLAEFWNYLSNYGGKERIIMPLLGTGNGRISLNRNEVFKIIASSFIASCAEKSYCEKLTIVIHPNALREYKIDIEDLDNFISFHSKYTTFNIGNKAPVGTPTI